MHETHKKCIDTMDKFAESGEDFELREIFGRFSMDTIASCAFGVDPQASSSKAKSKFVENVQQMFQQNFTDCLKFFLLLLPFNLGVKILCFLNITISKKEETEFFYEVIMAALKYRKDSKIRRNDLLDMMVDAIKTEKTDSNAGNLYTYLFYI